MHARRVVAVWLAVGLSWLAAAPSVPAAVRVWGPQPTVNGRFVVSVRDGDAWREVARVAATKTPQPATIALPETPAGRPVRVRITRDGGGAAYLDSVRLAGRSGVLTSGPARGRRLGTDLLAADDRNLYPVTSPLELEFAPAPGAALELDFTGRIESVVISRTPFQFPAENLYQELNAYSAFVPYTLGQNRGRLALDGRLDEVAGAKPFLAEYSLSGSGHPSGNTYFWVRNDDTNLYVSVDFTPDNTMDGNKDYAKVYAKTARGLKEFKVSMAEKTWGTPGFAPTPRAGYRHKAYEFRIPLRALDVSSHRETLALAFAAYGTASPGVIHSDAAYDPQRNRYLAVFGWNTILTAAPWGSNYVRAQFLDFAGAPAGVTFPVSVSAVTNHDLAPSVAYNPRSDVFLVAWGQSLPACCANTQFWVRAISGDGARIGTPKLLAVNGATPWLRNVDVAADPNGNGFVATWATNEPDGSHAVKAAAVAADGAPGAAAAAAWSTNTIATLDLVADTVNDAFVVGYRSGATLAVKRLDGAGAPLGVTTAETPVTSTTAYALAYDAANQRFVAAWPQGTTSQTTVGVLDPATGTLTPAGGAAVEANGKSQGTPALVAYGSPISYAVSWQENRDGAGASEIYEQHLTPAATLAGTFTPGGSHQLYAIVTYFTDYIARANPRCGNALYVWSHIDAAGHFGSQAAGPACPPLLLADATTADFGTLQAGKTGVVTFHLANIGAAGLKIGTLAAANPLAAPFSLASDGCSGQTLASGASCAVRVAFAPDEAGAFNDTFSVPSNDPSSVFQFAVKGAGSPGPNTPPTAPTLLGPADGAQDLESPVTFYWKSATDADGGTLAYELLVCKAKDFAGCEGVKAAAASPRRGVAPWGAASGLVVFGVVFAGLRGRRGLRALAVAGLFGLAAGGASCGGGDAVEKAAPADDEPEPPAGPDVHMKSLDGLTPGTRYYWKVVVTDPAGAATASPVWSFTTK